MNILTLVGITNAFAADAAAPSAQQSIMSMLPLFIILVLFMYFMIIRPQSKRAKEQKALLSNLKNGDEVLTSGGLLGKIEKISSDFVILNVASGVNITVQKNAIVTAVPKGTSKSVEQ